MHTRQQPKHLQENSNRGQALYKEAKRRRRTEQKGRRRRSGSRRKRRRRRQRGNEEAEEGREGGGGRRKGEEGEKREVAVGRLVSQVVEICHAGRPMHVMWS